MNQHYISDPRLFTFPLFLPSTQFYVFACIQFHKQRLTKPSPFCIWICISGRGVPRAPWRNLLPHRLRTHVFDVRGVIREHAVRCRVSITLPVSRWILPPYWKTHAPRGSAHPWGFRAHHEIYTDGWLNASLFILLQHLCDHDICEWGTLKCLWPLLTVSGRNKR